MAALPAPKDDDILVETYYERLEALKEMFPAGLRNVTRKAVSGGWTLFTYGKQAAWIFSTTAMLMVLPYIVSKEIADTEKAQIAQQRQMLLGPQAAVQGSQPRY
uniref:Mitochondrial import receptor subunit TOM22 homolog n=1 Tax=Panagrolaimus sp. PS1159 TaxID=55785 RepID=A0AC35GL99_9BILA